MKQNCLYIVILLSLFLAGCSREDEMNEYQRTESKFVEELGCQIGLQQMWRTSVKIQINVTTDTLVQFWLVSSQQNATLYDYKEISSSGVVTMTAPQGIVNTIYLSYSYKNRIKTKTINLTGKPIEVVNISTIAKNSFPEYSFLNFAGIKSKDRPFSLCGPSRMGNAQYFQLSTDELFSFFGMMSITTHPNVDTSAMGINYNYELSSNGPFWLTWTSGYGTFQTSHILGYYYHSPGTYEDITYVDISETHKWDYIDGLCKVQYQIDISDNVNGFRFVPGKWYDANFDASDSYNSVRSGNMDRIGDSAFCIVSVFHRYGEHISAIRGISFLVDVPAGKHIGFYLRSDEEPYPSQWQRLKSKGVRPSTTSAAFFRGTCFSASDLNVDGERRSSIWEDDSVIWMGMEDYVVGGDNDCNDVVFCVAADVKVYNPEIIIPDLVVTGDYSSTLPWTLAFEDVYRGADFDFNDVVVKLSPKYDEEKCCVSLMAAGSDNQMFLCYDGPEGIVNFGEVHTLLGDNRSTNPINTTQSQISTPFVELDCVPWPKNYTMEQDAGRFYILVKRGTCSDCTDTLSLATTPGQLPKAALIAGEWKWPMEGTSIITAYPSFRNWAADPTRITYWNWHRNPAANTFVSY